MTLPVNSAAVKAITKNSIREEVYADFNAQDLQKSLHPMRHHIPVFPTAKEAVSKLAELPEYQNASTVVTKTGHALKAARLRALKDQKKLLVPIPFPADIGTFYLLDLQENTNKKLLQKYVTRLGLNFKSKIVPADSNCKADIIILGSVAVDKQGRRIGSGKDYCDLELSVMVEKGVVTKDTIMATIVHDIQVKELLPEELFGEHDVRVGLIITPTRVIRVDPPPAPLPGIRWKLVTKSMLKVIPILGELYDAYSRADPCACELKEESAEEEVRPRRRMFRLGRPRSEMEGDADASRSANGWPRKRRRKPRRQTAEDPKSCGTGPGQPGESARPTRTNNRRRRKSGDVEKQNGRKPYKRRRYQIDFSLCVRNFASDVRVRDLKNALAECHVKPAEIKWRGQEGYAVLHFARDGQDTSDTPTSMDGMISSLRNLKVSAAQEDGLAVEPCNRVTRIEVTNQVTAV